jgi:hypothetical protein
LERFIKSVFVPGLIGEPVQLRNLFLRLPLLPSLLA